MNPTTTIAIALVLIAVASAPTADAYIIPKECTAMEPTINGAQGCGNATVDLAQETGNKTLTAVCEIICD